MKKEKKELCNVVPKFKVGDIVVNIKIKSLEGLRAKVVKVDDDSFVVEALNTVKFVQKGMRSANEYFDHWQLHHKSKNIQTIKDFLGVDDG